jgi:hypothetical protein
MKNILGSFYVLNISVQERHGFNVLFRKLASDKDVSQCTARKILSGVRLQAYTVTKVNKHTAQVWLNHWHKLGLVTLIHGCVRSGSISVCSSVLDNANNALVRNCLL